MARAARAPVPGPPRGRRRAVLGGVVQRVAAMRTAEQAGGGPRDVLSLGRDVILLLKDLAADSRVARRDKLVAALGAAYLASPIDLLPDAVPVLGQLDDLAVAVLVLRRLLGAAGYDVLYDLWRGSDEGLALVLTLAGVQH